jgi:uncharacterized protein YaaN involved in tellurite resistance
MENAKVALEKMPKHINLHRAINDMQNLSDHIENIVEKITGPRPTNEENRVTTSDPTLNEVLAFGADRIRETLDKSHQLLSEIEQALF